MKITAQAIAQRESRFPFFLLAVVLPLFVLPFASVQGGVVQRIVLPLAIDLLIVQSLLVMPPWQWRWRGVTAQSLYVALGVLGAIDIWIPFVLGQQLLTPVRAVLIAIRAGFYILTAIRLIEIIASSQRVNTRTLCLGSAGYIHLGLTVGQLATLLQVLDSDSFRLGSISGGEELVSRLTYFAIVTIGTVGYGDVVPSSPVGECFVILFSIVSTLYVSLLIGLLLGRFIRVRSGTIVQGPAADKGSTT